MRLARLVVGGLAGAGAVGAGLSGVAFNDASRDDTGAITESGDLGVFRIRTGDCINNPDSEMVEDVDAVPCSEPHDMEVYDAFNLTGATYPGQSEVEQLAADGCYQRFEAFVGIPYDTSVLYFNTMFPTPESWDQLDDREVLCVILTGDGTPLTGSMRGTAR